MLWIQFVVEKTAPTAFHKENCVGVLSNTMDVRGAYVFSLGPRVSLRTKRGGNEQLPSISLYPVHWISSLWLCGCVCSHSAWGSESSTESFRDGHLCRSVLAATLLAVVFSRVSENGNSLRT